MNLNPNKIYKVSHTIEIQGQYPGIFFTDLQHDDGHWYLVFEWTHNHDGEFPSIRHEVDLHTLIPHGPDQLVISHPVCIDSNPSACEYVLKTAEKNNK